MSGDPSANVVGTPMPRPAPSVDIPRVPPLQFLVDAVAAATRTTPDAITRKGDPRAMFVALARDQGWRQTMVLADVTRCTPPAIQRIVQRVDEDHLEALRLCAGDARLRELPRKFAKRDRRTA